MMRRSALTIAALALAAASLLAGCVSRDETWELWFHHTYTFAKGNGSSPLASIEGSYVMTGFALDWISRLGSPVRTLTEEDFTAWAGSLIVSPSSLAMSMSTSGQPFVVENWYIEDENWSETFAYTGVSMLDSTHGVFHTDVGDLNFIAGADFLTLDFGYTLVPIVEAPPP